MNTNSNTYTVIYTTILVVIVAAILAFAASALKQRQQDNMDLAKMKTIMLAANMGQTPDGNVDKSADFKKLYTDHITNAFAIDAEGNVLEGVDAFKDIDLKSQYSNLKKGLDVKLPVYECTMDDGRKVNILAMYGAGLWGPVWGYVAFNEDLKTIAGAYFDHASETPGLGAKIKDDPAFRALFQGKVADFQAEPAFSIVKEANADNQVDAITGATMTSKGLSAAIGTWFKAYAAYFNQNGVAPEHECMHKCEGEHNCEAEDGCEHKCCKAEETCEQKCEGEQKENCEHNCEQHKTVEE